MIAGGQRGSWLTSSVSKLIWGWGKAPEKTLATEEVGVNNACEQASCLFVPSAREVIETQHKKSE